MLIKIGHELGPVLSYVPIPAFGTSANTAPVQPKRLLDTTLMQPGPVPN